MTTNKSTRLERLLDLQLAWIHQADAKIATTLAIDAAMLGSLASSLPPRGELQGSQVATGVTSLLLLSSLFSLLWAIFPRTQAPNQSVIYFGGIASRGSAGEYLSAMSSLSEDEHLLDLASQTWRNAQIARTKHKLVSIALSTTMVAIIPWCAALWFHRG